MSIEDWRIVYTTWRPHSSLGNQTPAEYAAYWSPDNPEPLPQRVDSSPGPRQALGDWEDLVTFDKPRRPYVVRTRRYDADGEPLLVLFDPAMQTPFGAASGAER